MARRWVNPSFTIPTNKILTYLLLIALIINILEAKNPFIIERFIRDTNEGSGGGSLETTTISTTTTSVSVTDSVTADTNPVQPQPIEITTIPNNDDSGGQSETGSTDQIQMQLCSLTLILLFFR